MATRRRLIRPDFEADTRGVLVLGEWLTQAETHALRKQLPDNLPIDKREIFLNEVNSALAMCDTLKRQTTAGLQKTQLEAVADQARKLLQLFGSAKLESDTQGSIDAFSADFLFKLAGTTALTKASEAAVKNEGLLPHFWDTVQDIEAVFSYAANQMNPSKQDRPAIRNARALVADLARAHFKAFSKWPAFTKASKSNNIWFPGFVAALPKRLGLAPGADVIRAVIQELKRGV